MPEQVKVDDLEVFSRFRVAMLKFAQAASHSLSNADGQIARTHSWLENEQRAFWEGQLRKRMEAVTNARELLRQKKLYKDASGRTPGVTEEEKALAKCLAAAEHARERIESIRKWLPKLERAAGFYRGGVTSLSKTVGEDIPKAVSLLDRLAVSLEQYVQIEAAITDTSDSAPATSEPSIARGNDGPTAPPPAAKDIAPPPAADDQTAPAPQNSTETPASTEVRHVADGQ